MCVRTPGDERDAWSVLLHERKSSKALMQEGISSGVGCKLRSRVSSWETAALNLSLSLISGCPMIPSTRLCRVNERRVQVDSARPGLMIRLVTFDALHTLITPRKPIHVQYATEFRPYLGNLPPDAIARSFKLGVSFSITTHSLSGKTERCVSTPAGAGRETVVPCRCGGVVE